VKVKEGVEEKARHQHTHAVALAPVIYTSRESANHNQQTPNPSTLKSALLTRRRFPQPPRRHQEGSRYSTH
jgi:hypothetical protein